MNISTCIYFSLMPILMRFLFFIWIIFIQSHTFFILIFLLSWFMLCFNDIPIQKCWTMTCIWLTCLGSWFICIIWSSCLGSLFIIILLGWGWKRSFIFWLIDWPCLGCYFIFFRFLWLSLILLLIIWLKYIWICFCTWFHCYLFFWM